MTSDVPPTEDQPSAGDQPPAHNEYPPPPGVSAGPFTGSSTGPAAETRSAQVKIDELFDRIRSLGIVRPDEGRWGAGVGAGISRRLDIDPILVRGAFVALSIIGGLGVAAYGLGWLLLPQTDGRIHLQEATRGRFSAGFAGAVLLSLAAFGSDHAGPWGGGVWLNWGLPYGLLVTVAVIAGIWWLAKNGTPGSGPASPYPAGPTAPSGTSYSTIYETPPTYGSPTYGSPAYGGPAYGSGQVPPAPSGTLPGWSPPPPLVPAQPPVAGRKPRDLARERSAPSRALVRLTLGVALLVAAAVLVIGHRSHWSAPVGVIASASALLVIANGVIVSGFKGRRAAGLTGIGFILVIATLAGAGAHEVGIRSGQNLAVVGSQEWRPSTAKAANSQYNLGVGEATLWLTNPAILANATAADPLRISARIGAGHLVIVVPDAVAAQLHIQIGAGEVVNPQGKTTQVGGKNGGATQNETLNTGPAGQPLLIVQVQQGVGQLEIKTASQASGTSGTPAAPTAAPTAIPSTPAALPTHAKSK